MNNMQHIKTYTSYGFTLATSDIGFNSDYKINDLYLMGNGYRLYNPKIRKFYSADTLSFSLQAGINPYTYLNGDPINYIDPNGHLPKKLKKLNPFAKNKNQAKKTTQTLLSPITKDHPNDVLILGCGDAYQGHQHQAKQHHTLDQNSALHPTYKKDAFAQYALNQQYSIILDEKLNGNIMLNQQLPTGTKKRFFTNVTTHLAQDGIFISPTLIVKDHTYTHNTPNKFLQPVLKEYNFRLGAYFTQGTPEANQINKFFGHDIIKNDPPQVKIDDPLQIEFVELFYVLKK